MNLSSMLLYRPHSRPDTARGIARGNGIHHIGQKDIIVSGSKTLPFVGYDHIGNILNKFLVNLSFARKGR